MAVMTSAEFVKRAKEAATEHKTLYVMGCFGAPMTASNKARYTKNHEYNKAPKRAAMINGATSDTFGFDCVCLIKGLLWGWRGDKTKSYGGARYETNGVPDINADKMIKTCAELSSNFTSLAPGEAVWKQGHIGIYIGDGLAVECTPSWKNGVQITACNCTKDGYNRRDWTMHGKLPYIDYSASVTFKPGDLVQITGSKYYAGNTIPGWVKKKRWYVKSVSGNKVVIDRSEDGANFICSPVNAADLKLAGRKSIDEIAAEVIAGKWGNGLIRKTKLKSAGYDYATVQKRVNELLK